MRVIMVFLFSASGVSAIDNECVADHEAGAGAAQPKNGGGDFRGLAKSPNRLVPQDFFHGVGFLGQHVHNHRRVNRPRAHRIDANTSGSIFERGTLGLKWTPNFGQ